MTPLSDRAVVTAIACTLGLVAALVFWFVRLHPVQEMPLQWRDSPAQQRGGLIKT
ncbi:MAG: hypothetical protein NTZ53_09415 [Cyanobacteria bacterium]|nr:hypothetical protein [Cyanobacteriota bacterium]